MNNQNNTPQPHENPPSVAEIKDKAQAKHEEIIDFCTNSSDNNFYLVEKLLRSKLYQLACIYLQLYLMVLQDKFDYSANGEYYKGGLVPRTLKTIFGEVRYWRSYFTLKQGGGGFYP